MTTDELNRIGETLFGGNWIGPLATALGVRETSIRRMAQGRQYIPAGIARDIVGVAERRRDEILELLQEIGAQQ